MSSETKQMAQTLIQFITKHFHGQKEQQSDLALLFTAIQQACKSIAALVRVAPIEKLIGVTGSQNSHGEEVKTLDVISNEQFKHALIQSEKVCAMVSEEEDEVISVPKEKQGDYLVFYDPIDGSSNIDNAIPVGTIFAIYKRVTSREESVSLEKDVLQKGINMIAAGYAIYGSCTTIVVALQQGGVNGFTLDPVSGEFLISHPQMTLKKKGSIYSVNEGNSTTWHEQTKQYVNKVKTGEKPYSLRYAGSMVADIHRTLISGGIFLYPADKKSPEGKLRLLYECNPMSFIIEKAKGIADTGDNVRILDIQPKKIHQRSPIVLGSAENVNELLALKDAL